MSLKPLVHIQFIMTQKMLMLLLRPGIVVGQTSMSLVMKKNQFQNQSIRLLVNSVKIINGLMKMV